MMLDQDVARALQDAKLDAWDCTVSGSLIGARKLLDALHRQGLVLKRRGEKSPNMGVSSMVNKP